MLTTDSGQSMALVLLDLSYAFDLINHDILISRLETCVGLRGTVLQWFRVISLWQEVRCQHWTPFIFWSTFKFWCSPEFNSWSCFVFPLYASTRVSFHLYADDTQIYIPMKWDDKQALKPILDCLEELKHWLATNFMSLN